MEEMLKAYGTLGAGGLLICAAVWLIRHLITVTIPSIHDRFCQQMDKEREACQKNHEAVVQQLNGQHEKNMSAHTDTRHELAELAHVAGLKKAIEELQARKQQEKT